jgi:pimeloyl-ACP methyl ester carboxylesterase
MSKVCVNGLNIHYWRVGEGPDDVVMLHGLTGNLAIWHLKLVPMMRDEFRITTYDLRGHGRSDMPPTGYTTADHAVDLEGLLDVLGMERVHLVGHSLGADVCLHFALRYPDRAGKLVLIEPAMPALAGLQRDKDWEGWAYWARMLEEFAGVKVPREKWTDLRYMIGESAKVPIIFGPAQGRPRKMDRVFQLVDSTTLLEDYEVADDMTLENLAKMPHPKLMIYDSDSPYLRTYRLLRDLLINCTTILLPGGGRRHFSPLETPELVVEHILPFLNSGGTVTSSASQGNNYE